MTKPADSDQIARARAFINKKYPDGDFAQYTDPIEDLIRDCATFAASERQAVIEDCAKAVCFMCKDRERWNPAEVIEGSWEHGLKSRPNLTAVCNAAAIRSME